MSERIPDEVIESVKRNSSFRSLLSGYGISLGKRGKTQFITCPFHKIEGKTESVPSCSIDLKENLYHCFSCNAGGNIIQFVMAYEKVPFFEAVNKLLAITPTLTKRKNTDRKPPESVQKPLNEEEKQAIFREIIDRSTDALRNDRCAREYLESRGLDPLFLLEHYTMGYWSGRIVSGLAQPEREKLKSIGFITESGNCLFERCVIFPLYSIEGKVTTIYGRRIVKYGDAHHFMLPGTPRGLYLPRSGLDPQKPVVVTESIIDALSLFTAGTTNVLPQLGVNGFFPDHRNYLQEKSFPKVFIALNGDLPGKRAAAQLAEHLQANRLLAATIDLPDGTDLNDMLCERGSAKLREWIASFIEEQPENPTVWEDALYTYILLGSREYRINGLSAAPLDRLRVSVKVYDINRKHQFHLDTFDLYQCRARELFIGKAAPILSVERELLTGEVNQLITTLEELRLKMVANSTAHKKEYIMTEEERREALEYLQAPNLLERIRADIRDYGFVGNDDITLLVYLCCLSRITDKALGILLVARSGTGKTTLQNIIASFTPEEFVLHMTRLTGQSLFYQGQDGLTNKLLTIEEDEGMQDALYAIRVLLSSQKLCVQSIKTDQNGEHKAYENVVNGPASVIISTTDPSAFDHETLNRFLVVHLDESVEQTRRIELFQNKMMGPEGIKQREKAKRITRLHQNIQRLIKPLPVMNNIGLGIEYPEGLLHTRRERNKVATLIETVALLHQYQRSVQEIEALGNTMKYIEVTKEDVLAVKNFAAEVLCDSIDELPKLCRELLEYIHELVHERYQQAIKAGERVALWQVAFTRKELKDHCGWSMWHLREHLPELVELGYIAPRMGRQGQRYAYSLVDEKIPNPPQLTFKI